MHSLGFFEIHGFGASLHLRLHVLPLFLGTERCWGALLALTVIYEPSAWDTRAPVHAMMGSTGRA